MIRALIYIFIGFWVDLLFGPIPGQRHNRRRNKRPW